MLDIALLQTDIHLVGCISHRNVYNPGSQKKKKNQDNKMSKEKCEL